jgi:Mn2+/Fe2+ NRAMP family transporter
VILIFILLLLNSRDLMGEPVNGKIYNAAAVITVAGIVLVTLILLVLTIIGKA